MTIRSLVKLQHEPAGFNPDHVLTLSVSLPTARYPTAAQKADFWQRTLEALREVPGVELAGGTSRLPLLPGNSTRGLMIRDLPPNVQANAHYRTASPDYFRAMGIRLLRGRAFEEADREGRPLVAVVSASAAQRFWPNRDPIGERFSINDPQITVVGVVGDVHSASLDSLPQPTVYVPYRRTRGRRWCSRSARRLRRRRCRTPCAVRSGRSTRINPSAPCGRWTSSCRIR